MTNHSIILFFSCLLTVSCNSKSPIKNDQKTQTKTRITNPDNIKNDGNVSSDSLTMLISAVGTSFHEWYIETLNDDNNTTRTGAYVIKGEHGKCKLVNDLYFLELRKLGTISEKFIYSEEERTKACADYLSTVNWKKYQNSDAYEYSDNCPEFDYDYWTQSQEVFSGVMVDKLEQIHSKWIVTLAFYYDELQNFERRNQPRVTVENEAGKWMITKIDWIKNN